MTLIERINHLRLQAALLFDIGKAKDVPIDEVTESIRPLRERLQKEIRSASVKDRLMSIKHFQNMIGVHRADISMIEGKIEDCETHIRALEESVKDEMKAKGVPILDDNGYSVSLVNNKLLIR